MNGGPTDADGEVLLEVSDLKKHFPVAQGLMTLRSKGSLKAVDGVSFQLKTGQTLGLVGESGCGKSTTARMILMLERPSSGTIRYLGDDIHRLSSAGRKRYRTSVQAVFQDPWSSLNPRMRARDIIAEPLRINLKQTRREVIHRVGELLEAVGLNQHHANLFPHEFSGGQRQRLAIARALALTPDLIVMDEPVSALDVSIRAQILNLLKDLQRRYNLSYLLIAHNLATVRHMCRQVAVMYLGKIVEEADSRELFTNPLHPYTKAVISASLPADPDTKREEIVLTGEVPSPIDLPSGCRFHTRCPSVMPHCQEAEPFLKHMSGDHRVACYLHHGDSVG